MGQKSTRKGVKVLPEEAERLKTIGLKGLMKQQTPRIGRIGVAYETQLLSVP